jgi:TIR domain
MRGDVFLDFQNIQLTKDWRHEIDLALWRADVVIVFWCFHSEDSPEVAREWRKGVSLGKPLLPILLDDTALPHELGRFQGVDFRAIVKASHDAGRTGPETGPAMADDERADEYHALNPMMLPVLLVLVLWMLVNYFIGTVANRIRDKRAQKKMAVLLYEQIQKTASAA